jgi:hypothetical protein
MTRRIARPGRDTQFLTCHEPSPARRHGPRLREVAGARRPTLRGGEAWNRAQRGSRFPVPAPAGDGPVRSAIRCAGRMMRWPLRIVAV